MTSDPVTRYVLDTNVLYWYWHASRRLSSLVASAINELEAVAAIGLIPVIALSELYYLLRKQGRSVSMLSLITAVDDAPALRLDPLTDRHLSVFDGLESISEMHDRLIAASAIVHDCPLLTADPELHACSAIRTVW